MIGIVVVSHSWALANAAVDLAQQMVEGGPAIAIAAGLDETTLGTDANAVAEAITKVDSPDGVLMFLDLGSAIMSAEMALEFVDPAVAARVRMTPAPLVEGLVAAVVTAAGNANIDTVERMALGGLKPKQIHIGVSSPVAAQPPAAPAYAVAESVPEPEPAPEPEDDNDEYPVLRIEVPAPTPLGLHLRPVSRIANAVTFYEADIFVSTKDREPVPAGSMLELQTLGAGPGDTLIITAQGPGAEKALAALQNLADKNFGEGDYKTFSH